MKNIRLYAVAAQIAIGAATVSAQHMNKIFELTPFSEARFYGWKEFGADGSELLSESGTQFGIGVKPKLAFGATKRWFVKGDLALYFGTVDYRGHLFDRLGNLTPFNTTVGYFGFESVSSVGHAIPLSPNAELSHTVGFGVEHWSREIDKGGTHGYTEIYTVPLVDLNIEGTFFLGTNAQLTPWVGMRIPLSISESIDLSKTQLGGPADLSLSPGVSPRYRFGADGSFYRFLVSFSFEAWTLNTSPVDRGYHQPESTRKVLMLKIGYAI